ncbi:hypothetical protein GCK72_011150 [Caenorhabditis remanei]|uniref:ATP-dependent DNA helicase n=1 Tax=Caenorhabditis remanei TaxID=31234 RepID=A0A6A5H7P1_CAERE|nr:hypothetical protein GCK72_011150 [Caenorhabditis remanei]KAF1762886.1 hypothetical protein GCK72_011150 [Caenorhabditis remanei]
MITLLFGDFLQLSPRNTSAQKKDELKYIYDSYFWKDVVTLHLTKNMRTSEDPSYGDLVLRWREGVFSEQDRSFLIQKTVVKCLANMKDYQTVAERINNLIGSVDHCDIMFVAHPNFVVDWMNYAIIMERFSKGPNKREIRELVQYTTPQPPSSSDLKTPPSVVCIDMRILITDSHNAILLTTSFDDKENKKSDPRVLNGTIGVVFAISPPSGTVASISVRLENGNEYKIRQIRTNGRGAQHNSTFTGSKDSTTGSAIVLTVGGSNGGNGELVVIAPADSWLALSCACLAINLVSFCQQCNSRSATHTGCRPVICLVCRSPEHSLASGICLDPELRELTAEQLRDRANHHRRDYLRHIRGLLASPNNPLQYRLPSDSPYISLYRREVPAGEERRGLQILRVENNEFPGTRLAEYRGAPGSLIREFLTLRPPEFDNWNQLMIPIFDEDSARYLEEIARVVTRIREDPNSARTFELPAAPHANQNGVRLQHQNPVLPAEPPARPAINRPAEVPNANQAIRGRQPLVETPILRADPPGLRAPPTVPPYVPAGTTNQAKANAAKNRASTNYMRRPPPRPLTEDPGSQPCSSSQIAPTTSQSEEPYAHVND